MRHPCHKASPGGSTPHHYAAAGRMPRLACRVALHYHAKIDHRHLLRYAAPQAARARYFSLMPGDKSEPLMRVGE